LVLSLSYFRFRKAQRKLYVVKFLLALLLANLSSFTSAQTAAGNAFLRAEELFRQNPEWLGTDGANSTPLGNNRIFWSFEDTFDAVPATAVVRDGK
jgi:hypothetical protein